MCCWVTDCAADVKVICLTQVMNSAFMDTETLLLSTISTGLCDDKPVAPGKTHDRNFNSPFVPRISH